MTCTENLVCTLLEGAATWWFNVMIPEPLPIYSESFMMTALTPLQCRGTYSATSNYMKLVHWPLMGGLVHLVQWGGDWVGSQAAQALPCGTKYNIPPINGQCTD